MYAPWLVDVGLLLSCDVILHKSHDRQSDSSTVWLACALGKVELGRCRVGGEFVDLRRWVL